MLISRDVNLPGLCFGIEHILMLIGLYLMNASGEKAIFENTYDKRACGTILAIGNLQTCKDFLTKYETSVFAQPLTNENRHTTIMFQMIFLLNNFEMGFPP